MKVAFVEGKSLDQSRIAELLKHCQDKNLWANRGPVYRMYQERVRNYMNLPDGTDVVPVANGGVALEAMARLHAKRFGRPLRWVGSAYSFQNLGRGYFSDIHFCDCDDRGLLDLAAVKSLDPSTYDGIIVTNPFGLYGELGGFTDFAKKTGKIVLADNAAGFFSQIPDLQWQAFSLHHTKPYGMGEGGLALVPAEDVEELYKLVSYGPTISEQDRPFWFQNGKLSDISCAILIDRLDNAPEWVPRNVAQRDRLIGLATRTGLVPLCAPTTGVPLTSMPFLSDVPIEMSRIDETVYVTCSKYYRPLSNLPRAKDIYARLVNIPCHADMIELSDDQIEEDIRRLLAPNLTDCSSAYRRHPEALLDHQSDLVESEDQAPSEASAIAGGYRAVASLRQRS